MSEEEIKEILSHPELERNLIREEKELLQLISEQNEYMEQFQQELAASSFLKSTINESGVTYHDGSNDRMLSAIERAEKMGREHYLGLLERFQIVQEQKEMTQRVWACYESFGGMPHELLRLLYEKSQKWCAVELDLKISHSKCMRERKKGMKLILRRYESSLSISEITALRRKGRTRRKREELQNERKQHRDWD